MEQQQQASKGFVNRVFCSKVLALSLGVTAPQANSTNLHYVAYQNEISNTAHRVYNTFLSVLPHELMAPFRELPHHDPPALVHRAESWRELSRREPRRELSSTPPIFDCPCSAPAGPIVQIWLYIAIYCHMTRYRPKAAGILGLAGKVPLVFYGH